MYVETKGFTDALRHSSARLTQRPITLNGAQDHDQQRGASFVMENGNMTFYCPGAFTIKAASFSFQGPGKAPTPLPKSSLKISDQYSSSR